MAHWNFLVQFAVSCLTDLPIREGVVLVPKWFKFINGDRNAFFHCNHS